MLLEAAHVGQAAYALHSRRSGGCGAAGARPNRFWPTRARRGTGRWPVRRALPCIRLAFQPGSSSWTIAGLLALHPTERWGLLFGDRWIRLGEPSGEMPPVDTRRSWHLRSSGCCHGRAEKPLLVNCLRPAIQTKQSQHPAETPLRYSFIITEGDAP